MTGKTTPRTARSCRPELLSSAILAAIVGLAACEGEPQTPEPLYPGDVRTYVVPELAAELGPDGRFNLPAPPAEAYPQITAQQAEEIAVAWVRTFGKYFHGYLESRHGRRIDLSSLRIGSPVYYATTPYTPVPPDVHPGIRNTFGPRYILYMVSPDGIPVVEISVAAFTEAWVEGKTLRFPSRHGDDVLPTPIPVGRGFTMPVSPERAVQIAANASGARAALVPDLLLPERDYDAVFSRWKVTLDRPVTVRTAARGAGRIVRELYVGIYGQVFTPAEVQPQERVFYEPFLGREFRVQVRGGRPVAFEPATVSAP
jgi:hypothetical protein